jgi:hypothetical protein
MAMKRGPIVLAAVAGVAAGAGAVVRARRHAGAGPDRWHSVTINRTPEELGPKPPPLDELGFPVELRVQPAPGDRGTELAARIADGHSDHDTVRHLRRALREARSLAEVGEVLLPDAPGTAHKTVTGAPLDAVTRHAREEGRL